MFHWNSRSRKKVRSFIAENWDGGYPLLVKGSSGGYVTCSKQDHLCRVFCSYLDAIDSRSIDVPLGDWFLSYCWKGFVKKSAPFRPRSFVGEFCPHLARS